MMWNIPIPFKPEKIETPVPKHCSHKCPFGKHYQHEAGIECPGKCRCKDCKNVRGDK